MVHIPLLCVESIYQIKRETREKEKQTKNVIYFVVLSEIKI